MIFRNNTVLLILDCYAIKGLCEDERKSNRYYWMKNANTLTQLLRIMYKV